MPASPGQVVADVLDLVGEAVEAIAYGTADLVRSALGTKRADLGARPGPRPILLDAVPRRV